MARSTRTSHSLHAEMMALCIEMNSLVFLMWSVYDNCCRVSHSYLVYVVLLHCAHDVLRITLLVNFREDVTKLGRLTGKILLPLC